MYVFAHRLSASPVCLEMALKILTTRNSGALCGWNRMSNSGDMIGPSFKGQQLPEVPAFSRLVVDAAAA